MGLNLSGPAALCGLSLQAACQYLQQLCLYQAFWGRDWAGMMDWHKSRANLVMTSGQGTLNLWGSWAKH